jgi:outer membrane protein
LDRLEYRKLGVNYASSPQANAVELCNMIYGMPQLSDISNFYTNTVKPFVEQENSRASVNQKLRSLQTEMQDFQRKVENNAFLTRERAEQEQARLMKKQQELQDFDNRLAQELVSEQQRLNEQLRDTLVSQLRVYNKDKGYQVILSNTMGDNILLAGDAYDITKEVIEYLNKNYAPASK